MKLLQGGGVCSDHPNIRNQTAVTIVRGQISKNDSVVMIVFGMVMYGNWSCKMSISRVTV